MFELTDKVSIVTGATSGIGKAAAIALAKQGAKVAVTGRREAEGQAVVETIRAAGGEAIFVKTDVSVESEVDALFDQVKAHYGKIDSVFLNSGVFHFAPISEQTGEDLKYQLSVNVNGLYYGLKNAVKHLGKGGSVIFNSSVAATKGMPRASAYSLTKGAVNTLVLSSAVELATSGIRVNAIAPGPIWTEGVDANFGGREGFDAMMGPLVPMGRTGEPEEVAAAVVFLASDEASFITGQILAVDGGSDAA